MQEINIAEQKVFDGRVFPIVFTGPKGDSTASSNGLSSRAGLNDWLQNNKDEVDSLLLKHKAILFRGFDCLSATDLHEVIVSTQLKPMAYLGGAAVRTQRKRSTLSKR